MNIFQKFKKNKKVGILILVVFLLGLFLRFNDFGQESLHGDCMSHLGVALSWFYPHDYYPGLSGQNEPGFGHWFIGLGCLASGEDFSGVTEFKQRFYPGRQILIGEQVVKAEKHCHIPVYIFGLLFFIIISLFALMLLDIYSATYFISFFAFYPDILHASRWLQVNIVVFFFSLLGLLFLWQGYKSAKAQKNELIFFILSSISFAFAFSVKTPAAAYIPFFAFIILEKYKKETLFVLNIISEKLGLKLLLKYRAKQNLNFKSLLKTCLGSMIAYVSVLFITFEFNLMNIYRVIQGYRAVSGDINTVGLNPVFLYKAFWTFLLSINPLDMLVFLFSIYILVKLFFKKDKSNLEKFIIYLTCFLIFLSLTFQVLSELLRVFIIFFFGLILLMSLTFSNRNPLMTKFSKHGKNYLFFSFMVLYVIFSFFIVWSESPYFTSSINKLSCLTDEKCKFAYNNDRELANFMNPLLEEDETFLPTGFINYYLRREDDIIHYMFQQQFMAQLNRKPTLEDYMKYYHPMNRTVRYVIVNPKSKALSTLNLGLEYEPNYRLQIKGKDSKWIYDLQNLAKRK